MSLPRNRTQTQPSSVPQDTPPQDPADDAQPTARGTTPSGGGTTRTQRPVPCVFSLTITDLDPCDLTALLEGTPPAQTCPTCGRAYDLFDHDTSRLLDLVLVSREALSTATTALRTLTHTLEEDLP